MLSYFPTFRNKSETMDRDRLICTTLRKRSIENISNSAPPSFKHCYIYVLSHLGLFHIIAPPSCQTLLCSVSEVLWILNKTSLCIFTTYDVQLSSKHLIGYQYFYRLCKQTAHWLLLVFNLWSILLRNKLKCVSNSR